MIRKLLFLLVPLLALSSAVADERPRSITVSGRGAVTAEPDMAHMTMGVQKVSPDMSGARADVVAATGRFLALCRKLGIEEKQVRSSGLVIRPEYRWDQKAGQQVLTGYVVQRDLAVELTDLKRLGELVEGAVDAGVNQVSPPELRSTRERELRREALAAAAKDAEDNARVLAETLGVKLGKVRELSATDSGPMPMPMAMARTNGLRAGAEVAEATYATGSLRFETQVSASFDLIAN